jgi:hypothetical protein
VWLRPARVIFQLRSARFSREAIVRLALERLSLGEGDDSPTAVLCVVVDECGGRRIRSDDVSGSLRIGGRDPEEQ